MCFDEDQTVTLPRRQGLRRSDEQLQHMALSGVDLDGVCDPTDEFEFMPMPGPDPIPPLEDCDDEEDAEEAEDSYSSVGLQPSTLSAPAD